MHRLLNRYRQITAAWLRLQLAQHTHRFDAARHRDPSRLAALAASAADRLARGGDVSLGFYLEQPAYLSAALVTCSPNSATPELTCPAGRSE